MSDVPTLQQLAALWNRTAVIQPAPGQIVMAYGGAGQRFMRVDKIGQWRNMMNAPRATPTYWMPMLPTPEDVG